MYSGTDKEMLFLNSSLLYSVCFVVSDGEHKSNIKCVDVAVVLINNHPPEVMATAKGEVFLILV
jgi:hypothetical protein